ncbi:E3 ubiquitin-protein ligase RNF213 isoform X2 [Alligator mississippiensis]|uniref:E3 ubiquitin-protein ligase RNF213 isoform X2 n=1 Tax=Alligator mississippiensis TaxID=8496 RepID=UPI0028780FD8|nr:E3 ubiquitin-protein ligase RNF213 isoform X2 [Alligator mississippiensis]
MECLRCHFVSQDASPNFCSKCGLLLGPSLRTAPPTTEKGGGEAREMEMEMELEPGRSLRVEGVPFSGLGAETRDTKGKPEESLTQDAGAQTGGSKKKKRRRGKKNKKKKDALGMEQLDSLKSGAPSTDCSVVSERSCDPFPASESTTQEDEAAKPGAALPAGRTAGETKSSDSVGSLGDENKNTEMAVRDHCSSSTSLQDDACAKTAQPTGSTAPQEKMEDGNPKGDGQKGREERASEKQEDARSPAETEQPLGKASDAQTSGADGDAPGSKGAGEGDSPGLPTSAETPENEEASPSAEAVNQKSKVSPTEPPDTRSRGGKVEQESKQQAHAPASKATSQVVVGGLQKAAGGSQEAPKGTADNKKGPKEADHPKQDYASVVKTTSKKEEKQQANQKAGEEGRGRSQAQTKGDVPSNQKTKQKEQDKKATPRVVKQSHVSPAKGIMVYFHAVISKDFKLNPEQHKVFIRGEGISGYEKWHDNICELHCTKDLQEHGHLFEGYVLISKNNLDKGIAYKYYIAGEKKGEYEMIYKSGGPEGYINRYMHVSSDLCYEEWHQYDDIVCAPLDPSLMKKIKYFLGLDDTKKKVLTGKRIAGEIMLETIFSLLSTWSCINVTSFFNQLRQFYVVTSNPMVYQGRPEKWTSLEFGTKEVNEMLLVYLRKLGKPLLERGASAPPENWPVKSKLELGLITLVIGECYGLQTSKEDLTQLCSLLCLEEKLGDDAFHKMGHILEPFMKNPCMKQYLIHMCERCMESQVDQWVWILPLLHFFAHPFDPVRRSGADSHQKSEEDWAGLEGLAFNDFKMSTSYQGNQLLKLMERKAYLLRTDEMLGRSWFCLLPVDVLGEFLTRLPVQLLDALVGIYHQLQSSYITYTTTESIGNLLSKLTELLDRHQKRPLPQDVLEACLIVCSKLYDVVCKKNKSSYYHGLTAAAAVIVSRASGLTSLEVSKDASTSGSHQSISVVDTLNNLLSQTRKWLRDCLSKPHYSAYGATLHNELEVWDRFVRITFPDEQFTETWKKTLVSDLEGKIKKEPPVQLIKDYCAHHDEFNKLDSYIGKSFENCAIEAVNMACQSQKNLLDMVSSYDLSKFGKLVSAVITKSWIPDKNGRPVDDFDEVLLHLLTWPDIKHLFNFSGANGQVLDQLTDEAKQLMAMADSVFMHIDEHIKNGEILVKRLDLILKHKKQFLCIWELKHKHLPSPERTKLNRDLEKMLALRREEKISVERERKWVTALLDMCRMVQTVIRVDAADVEEKLQEDLGTKGLYEVCDVRTLDSPGGGPIKTYYNLSPELREVAEVMCTFKESSVFQFCWKKAAQEQMEEQEDLDEGATPTLPLDEVYDSLFSPCYREYQKLHRELISGELTFAKVDDVFRDFKNHYEVLKSDLRLMCKLQEQGDRKWIELRLRQIQQYHELDLAMDSAVVIAKIREDLNLSGDFSKIHKILNFRNQLESIKEERLDYISPDLMKAKQLLEEIKEPLRRCLEQFTVRKDFVNWVKEALEDVNELKVFVDLASISAGENDMDVDRVACFHDAVLGYSSLLYELKRESGFDDFMQCLKKLGKALESDENLPKKLRDSARHLEWLKTVKESHGSVELSSLSLATNINNHGEYVIRAPPEGQKVSLDTVLRLKLSESHGDSDEIRQYSLEELRELLNKLMLMSGKGDQSMEVDKFSEVFSSVQRLAQSFIDLYSAGNMLFRSWAAYVYCSPRSKACTSMDFCLKAIPKLVGRGEVTALLPQLCRTMESFLVRWKDFVSEKRSRYFYLNYYTAEQLVYLCGELTKGQPSERALMMLSFVKQNCTERDVDVACRRVVSRHTHTSFPDLPAVLATEDLPVQLKRVWGSYMEDMRAFLPNCLDMDALGSCLDHLAHREKQHVRRALPQCLQAGRPNLITCPRAEVLASALAIYMSSPGQPLPTFDEVLLCTPETSLEQVGLFLRRCLTPSDRGKIYTMLYADELSYDVGCRAEELFQRLLKQSHLDSYCLVILCDCEREHCYIPSAFSQYKVHATPQEELKDIQEYLRSHFVVTQPTKSAASVFKDHMCVRIVSSKRAGVGKSLYVKRLHEKLEKCYDMTARLETIRLIEPQVDESKVLRSLLPFLRRQHQQKPMIFHIDITSSVRGGIAEFLFKLLVLRYLADADGNMWLRQPHHLYVIEILETDPAPKKPTRLGLKYSFLEVFPKITCKSPKEVLEMETQGSPSRDALEPGMDLVEFCSEAFQRPFQYLTRFDSGDNLDLFSYDRGSVEGSPAECLQRFLMHCGVMDPSWSELRNFVWFLNIQLQDCEASVFCNPEFVQDTLQGFKRFVVTFMILMARDFATPSLNISDQSSGRATFDLEGVTEADLFPFRIRKKWESEPHPYLFFNEDHISMTFIGFHLQGNATGGIDAVSPVNGDILKSNVMTSQLYKGLLLQRVPFNMDFDRLPRHEKLGKLCMILGIEWPMDPDETYELTTDNVLKILAIEMRFRCGIPVIIMGETGCGKTRLIKFLCELRKVGSDAENMKLVKVHGGTSAATIYDKVREAEAVAKTNKELYRLDTILFFDEANTTEAISSIKEVLCDRTVEGKPLDPYSGLKIIAACNPYRKHKEEMIQRLESAGLGYRVKADETREKLGSIPLRQLVYRVHALPPSMIPLVWDFGQLNNLTEKMYIQQIVQRLTDSVPATEDELTVITEVLYISQSYMRERADECSFVSLRDVERCVEVFKWFYDHSDLLLKNLEELPAKRSEKIPVKRNKALWALVLATGVCYHASLEKKKLYRNRISKALPKPYNNQKGILDEICLMQDVFLRGVQLRETIAKNAALKENVFMMVICIELKIPLFLVGKPGSSKSLAKTIVADVMQGQAAYVDLYKELKQIHLVSFQCSPHSTPEGIIGTFKHCARFQDGKNLDEYVSVVVLDEIGLAEDSPKMPLKTLHPLLEDGCIDDDPLPHKKVGFIGISNWALDPAKMNRGIFVSRGDPNTTELIESAKGICSSDPVTQKIEQYFPLFAEAYDRICKGQGRDFFGLRDYYSLIKMVFALTKFSQKEPTPRDIAQAVLRNFSGKDDINALDTFTCKLPGKEEIRAHDISTIELVQQNIYSDGQDSECRYLLVLTENYAALQILQQVFFTKRQQPEIIFGSSFPKDQEYTQICRNINRVKICMETGQMVVLLNLQNLYESLYDALNQYYVHLGSQKYVDLGLGTHRVKCRVHPDFRLIVIEEKDVVYKRFPIPLINRLEKHYLDIDIVLERWQRDVVEELKRWVNDFTAVDTEKQLLGQQKYSPSDVFVGYHSDTCASVVLQVTERLKQMHSLEELMLEVKKEAQLVLLNCATPDSVIRLGSARLDSFMAERLAKVYFKEQQHTSLTDFVCAHIQTQTQARMVFTEVTTFSRLLTATDSESLRAEVQGEVQSLALLSLQQFDTEHSFLKEIRSFLDATSGNKILIIQTDFEDGSQSAQLIASAKYSAVNEINRVELGDVSVFVYFITKLSRVEGGGSYVGFHGGLWRSVHIDDLRRSKDMVSDVTALRNFTISQLFREDTDEPEPMIVDGEKQQEERMEVETAALEEEEYSAEVLGTTNLLRSCVQPAVGMLRDDNEGSSRSTRRVEILLGLLSNEDDSKASFLRISKNRLFSLLKKQEENSFHVGDWVLREASNLNALQEAGTFRQTLWKRVQNAVIPLLAHMVSVIDRDSNLELLVKPDAEDCVKALWMFIFNDLKLLDVPHNVGSRSSQTETILVPNNMNVYDGNKMPFSWRIKDYLEEIWLQAQYIQSQEGPAAKFVDIFQKTPLGSFISSLAEQDRNQLFHFYVIDFILLTMSVSCVGELQVLQTALLSCVEELQAALPSEERMLSLPWVHLGYHRFRSRLQNFSRILAVNPRVLKDLEEQSVADPMLARSGMVLDVFAALACTERLENEVLKCNPQAWLQQVKNLHMPIELVCTENYLQGHSSHCHQLLQEVRIRWNRIFSMSLLVEHVLLGVNAHLPELRDLVQRHILMLGKCLQGNSDLKTQETFFAVMKVLCLCKEEASKTICRYGLMPCPICLGDPQDPVTLPCDHVFCQNCIKQWLAPGQMICPYCRVNLPDAYNVTVSKELSEAIQKNAKFRQMCNSFFIDLVSTMCFKDNEPPEKDVIEGLLGLLFAHRKPFTVGMMEHQAVYTKSLSPFDDVVDRTPVIRSIVLKLLLKYSFEEVKDYLQEYLRQVEQNQILGKDDKSELYVLFVSCLEDSMYDKTGACSEKEQTHSLREEACFLVRYLQKSSQKARRESSIRNLQAVAKVRLCLDRAAELLCERHGCQERASEKRKYLEAVMRFCTHAENDWYRIYLVRRLANQYGMECAQRLANEAESGWIFPEEIIQQQREQPSQIDRYLVCGESYRVLRDAVGKAMLACKMEGIAAAQGACNSPKPAQAVHLLLAIFREVTVLYGCKNPSLHPKQEQCDALTKFIQSCEALASADQKEFAAALVLNRIPSLALNPPRFSCDGTLIEMAVHMAAVLLCGQNPILEPLRNLAFDPSSMQRAFLPTMPEDLTDQAMGWDGMTQLHWYTCANGHPCTIGECGRPMQVSRCIECNAEIGGSNHKSLPGFQPIQQRTDRTQTGHVLGDPRNGDVLGVSERALSPVVCLVIRLLMHSAMLLGATKDPQSLNRIVKPPVPDPVSFFLAHMQKDLTQLIKTLGKSADETVNVVHVILGSLFKDPHEHPNQWPVGFDRTLSTKQARNTWEGIIANTVVIPELKCLDRTLQDLNGQISTDERICSSPVVKIVYGDPTTFLSRLPTDSAVHCSKMWSCRKRISLENLGHVVQQRDGKDAVPLLWKFLQKEGELRLVKFLPDILALQRGLVKRFQNVTDVKCCTMQDFLRESHSDVMRNLLQSQVTTFLSVWNKLRRSLETNGEIKLPKDYCDDDLTLGSPFEILLPRRRGLGLCSTALVSYLIGLHNDFVHSVEKHTQEENKYIISPSEVADLHVISYEVERDLIPLILSNAQYSVEKGGETLQEFDLEKIQKQVVSRFLQGKPIITRTGIPTLVYRHDRNYEHLFNDIRNKLRQDSLPNATIGMITGELQSFNDICEALSVIDVVLGFLATAGGDADMLLITYVQDVLQMGDTSPPVLQALSRCSLKHSIALWQLLSTHKSEQLLRLKQDPFADISDEYKEELGAEDAKRLGACLVQAGLEAFLQELHEMIVLKLKHAQAGNEFNSKWGLKDAFISYLETKDSVIPTELEELFPEDILLSQCIAAWRAAAALKRDRRVG